MRKEVEDLRNSLKNLRNASVTIIPNIMTKEAEDLIKALKGAVDTYQYTGLDHWEQEVTAPDRQFAEEVLGKYFCGQGIRCDGGDPCSKGHK